MKVSRVMYVFLATGLLAAVAYGQYPFSDSFSNAGVTNTNWPASNQVPSDSLTRLCASGVYTITNQHKDQLYAGFVYHHFTTPTATFTASCVINRNSDSIAAGMWLCLKVPSAGYPSGYVLQLNAVDACTGYLLIYRYDTTGAVAKIFGAGYRQQNPLNPSDTLMVSKQGSTFTIFCNGVYIGSCTDNTFASGDLGLVVPGNSAVAFDNVLFTNQFTQGTFSTIVVDKFNNGRIEKSWITRGGCSYFDEHDTVLDISVPPLVQANCDTRLAPFDTFFSRMIVSWRSGDSLPYYGLYLRGPDTLSLIPRLCFAIEGNGNGSVFPDTSTVVYTTPIAGQGRIHGKGFWQSGMQDTLFYQDTIEVYRTTGSNYYYMKVNGNLFDSVATSSFPFPLNGAGIFCWGAASGGQNVFVDYFFIGPSVSSGVIMNTTKAKRMIKGIKFSPLTSRYLFDPLGRIVGRRDAYGRLTGKFLAPGFYITDEKKSGIIINKQER